MPDMEHLGVAEVFLVDILMLMSFWSGKFVWKREQVSYPPKLDPVIPESSHRDGKGGPVHPSWDPLALGLHRSVSLDSGDLGRKSESASMYEHVWFMYCISIFFPSPKSIEQLATWTIWTIYGELHLNLFLSFWRLLNGYTNMFLHHPTLHVCKHAHGWYCFNSDGACKVWKVIKEIKSCAKGIFC